MTMEIMKKLNVILLILVTLFQRTRGVSVNIKELKKIGSKSQLIQNLTEYLQETVVTPVISAGNVKTEDSEFREIIVPTLNEKIGEDDIKSNAVRERRKRAEGDVPGDDNLYCLSCFANRSTRQDQNCYIAQKVPFVRCGRKEKCYSELHPDYIRRGCKLQSLLNRTHVCKCPLCNDKPFDDLSYYEYKNIRDWKHDNQRLEVPLVGIDLFCKVCETKGTDNICKKGKNANFTVCERNQLCYMNVDGKNNHVSRGCIDRPIYNSIYFFCQSSLCNNRTLYRFKPITKHLRLLYIQSSANYFIPLKSITYLYFYVLYLFTCI